MRILRKQPFSLPVVLLSIILSCNFSDITYANSLYAITIHGWNNGNVIPAEMSAYDIDAADIHWQSTYTFDQTDYPTGMYRGPVGLAIDTTHYIFVTHENNLENSELGRVEGKR